MNTPPEDDLGNYSSSYSPESFWEKIKNYAIVAGREVVKHALELYYVLQRPDVPMYIKGIIIGALGYFLLPVDMIPDLLPGVGYTDDLGAIMTALAVAHTYIDDGVREKAAAKIEELFGKK